MQDDRREELEPCPFCGGRALVGCYFDITGANRPDVYRGHCVFGCCRAADELTREHAITAWNTRAASLPVPTPQPREEP